MLRIAHLVTHPIQYFAPLYRAMAEIPDVELTVLFGSDFGIRPSFDPGLSKVVQFDVPLLGGYSHEFLPNSGDGKPGGNAASFDCPELDRLLTKQRFDIVWIHGWGYRFQFQAAAAAKAAGISYLIRGESTLLEAPLFSLRWFRRYLKHRRIIRDAAACLYVGQQNRQFYHSLGVPEGRLLPAHYSVDARQFAKQRLSAEERMAVRQEHGADPETGVVVTVAKLIARKRVADIVHALAVLPQHVHLWVLGDGEESEKLKSLAEQIVPGRVQWFGFTNQQAIPGILSAADLFVLASHEETWGLVVNEAMACGLPAIVTDRAGCGADLILEGRTGFLYKCRDVGQLAGRLAECFSGSVDLVEMGRAAQQHVNNGYSVQRTAEQIAYAAREVGY